MANSTSKNIWIEREMILSPAFRKLNGRAMEVLLLFLYRRQWKQAGRKGMNIIYIVFVPPTT